MKIPDVLLTCPGRLCTLKPQGPHTATLVTSRGAESAERSTGDAVPSLSARQGSNDFVISHFARVSAASSGCTTLCSEARGLAAPRLPASTTPASRCSRRKPTLPQVSEERRTATDKIALADGGRMRPSCAAAAPPRPDIRFALCDARTTGSPNDTSQSASPPRSPTVSPAHSANFPKGSPKGLKKFRLSIKQDK